MQNLPQNFPTQERPAGRPTDQRPTVTHDKKIGPDQKNFSSRFEPRVSGMVSRSVCAAELGHFFSCRRLVQDFEIFVPATVGATENGVQKSAQKGVRKNKSTLCQSKVYGFRFDWENAIFECKICLKIFRPRNDQPDDQPTNDQR